MSDLLIVRAPDPDAECSPEFQYLDSYVLLQAREAFGRVVAVSLGETLPAGRCEAVLLLGPNVLISRRSLEVMRNALRSGLAEARPWRLADAGAGSPIYTLRGYERAERTFLEAGPRGASPPASHLPVSLLSFDRFSQALEKTTLERLLREPDSLPADGPGIGHAGLCHEFIDYYGEVRSDVLPFLPESAREVLEVGCGRGMTGRLIQERLGCRVTGVELNPVVAREAARHLHRVLHGDVQTLEIEGRFDVVLALELVEHLVEAEGFLARVKQLLAPGGRAIFSIPNVGHYSIVEDLIAGRWDYLPIGLLCYTHYRFFTRKTLADWLRRCGLERFDLIAQTTELPERPERYAAFEADLKSLSTKGFYVIVEG